MSAPLIDPEKDIATMGEFAMWLNTTEGRQSLEDGMAGGRSMVADALEKAFVAGWLACEKYDNPFKNAPPEWSGIGFPQPRTKPPLIDPEPAYDAPEDDLELSAADLPEGA